MKEGKRNKPLYIKVYSNAMSGEFLAYIRCQKMYETPQSQQSITTFLSVCKKVHKVNKPRSPHSRTTSSLFPNSTSIGTSMTEIPAFGVCVGRNSPTAVTPLGVCFWGK